jgi:hypothetical protein
MLERDSNPLTRYTIFKVPLNPTKNLVIETTMEENTSLQHTTIYQVI